MKLVKFKFDATREEYLTTIQDNRIVNEGVTFGDDGATPTAEIKEGKHRVRIRCRMVGGASRDNGFFFGTFFTGTMKEKEDGLHVKGVIVTEPLVHLIWLAIVVYFIIVCFQVGGISLVPIFLSLLLFFMFRPEYKKQKILFRYLIRAAKRTKKNNPKV